MTMRFWTRTVAVTAASLLALTGCGVGAQSGGANGDTVAVEELPSRDDVAKVVVSQAVVTDGESPELVLRDTKKKSA